jgi:NAD(P)-dependent dehydrogenase (short-subunit alcohol dehydrogenase family)
MVLSLGLLVLAPLMVAAQSADRAVLVTGATSGIGLKMTEVLAANGFFVYAGGRKAEDIARLSAMDNVQGIRLDVTVQDDIDAAVRTIEAEGRGLYGLINNAGVAVVGPLVEMPEEDMDFQLDVNLFGPYRVTKAFAPLLMESQGRIMTTGSISGILSGPLLGAYSMSKHGVEAYTDALANEMGQFGMAVSVVEPGNYNSQIGVSLVERMRAAGYTAENSLFADAMGNTLGGTGDRSQYEEPDDVAEAALHFMTSDRPKRRYMVVPNEREAAITIQQIMMEMVQLNEDHAFSFSRDELIEMLDAAMEATANR